MFEILQDFDNAELKFALQLSKNSFKIYKCYLTGILLKSTYCSTVLTFFHAEIRMFCRNKQTVFKWCIYGPWRAMAAFNLASKMAAKLSFQVS